MAREEFKFKGKNLSELQSMDLKSFAELTPARARRSLIRGFDKKLLKKIELTKKEINDKGRQTRPIRTHKRDTVIVPQMIGLTFGVYDGKEFQRIDIQEKMLGHFLGEFSLTRKKLRHGKAGIGATKSSTAIATR